MSLAKGGGTDIFHRYGSAREKHGWRAFGPVMGCACWSSRSSPCTRSVAECPNACNGHGNCGYFDICHCYRGGRHCSQRTCAYGYAFTTTPQGDLNMDGDRDRLLSDFIHVCNLQLIKVGDGVRICNENFVVNEIRGRTIVGNDDFLDPNEHDDVVIDQLSRI